MKFQIFLLPHSQFFFPFFLFSTVRKNKFFGPFHIFGYVSLNCYFIKNIASKGECLVSSDFRIYYSSQWVNFEYKTTRDRGDSSQEATPPNSSSILNDLRGLRHYSAILCFNHLDNHILLGLSGAITAAAAETTNAAMVSTAAAESTAVTTGVIA